MTNPSEDPSETPILDKLVQELQLDGMTLIENIKRELKDKLNKGILEKNEIEEALKRIPEIGAREELQKQVLTHLVLQHTYAFINLTGHNPHLNTIGVKK